MSTILHTDTFMYPQPYYTDMRDAKEAARHVLKKNGVEDIAESGAREREIYGYVSESDDKIVRAAELPEGWGITDVQHMSSGRTIVGVGPVPVDD
jgi:hypothetical protein